MSTELGLKGNDLIIFAIIYGFCQVEGHCYNGSIAYLQEWTNSSRQGCIKNLNNLVDMGLITKVESTPTNKYYVNYVNNGVNLVTNLVTPDVNLVTEVSKQSLHNNINNNTINNINKYEKQKEINDLTEEVIKYLNKKCHTNFKSNTSSTKKLIKARLNDGYKLDDFKKVIDVKYFDWGERPVKFSNGQMSNEYLRPQTLFGTKFENYIYEANVRETSEGFDASTSVDISDTVSDLIF